MNKELATEILSFHADQLCAGVDITANLSSQYPELAPMLEVAHATYLQLQPVAMPGTVKQAMYAQFGRAAHKTASQPTTPIWRRTGTAVGIGSVLTGIALLLVTRRIRAE